MVEMSVEYTGLGVREDRAPESAARATALRAHTAYLSYVPCSPGSVLVSACGCACACLCLLVPFAWGCLCLKCDPFIGPRPCALLLPIS